MDTPKVTEQQRADLSIRRGKDIAQMKDPQQRQKYVAEQGEDEAKGKSFEDIKRKTDNLETGLALRGSFKRGGKVPATGAYKLHKGEVVIPVETETPAEEKAEGEGKEYSCRTPREVGDGLQGGGSLPVVLTPREEKLRLNYRTSKAYTPK